MRPSPGKTVAAAVAAAAATAGGGGGAGGPAAPGGGGGGGGRRGRRGGGGGGGARRPPPPPPPERRPPRLDRFTALGRPPRRRPLGPPGPARRPAARPGVPHRLTRPRPDRSSLWGRLPTCQAIWQVGNLPHREAVTTAKNFPQLLT